MNAGIVNLSQAIAQPAKSGPHKRSGADANGEGDPSGGLFAQLVAQHAQPHDEPSPTEQPQPLETAAAQDPNGSSDTPDATPVLQRDLPSLTVAIAPVTSAHVPTIAQIPTGGALPQASLPQASPAVAGLPAMATPAVAASAAVAPQAAMTPQVPVATDSAMATTPASPAVDAAATMAAVATEVAPTTKGVTEPAGAVLQPTVQGQTAPPPANSPSDLPQVFAAAASQAGTPVASPAGETLNEDNSGTRGQPQEQSPNQPQSTAQTPPATPAIADAPTPVDVRIARKGLQQSVAQGAAQVHKAAARTTEFAQPKTYVDGSVGAAHAAAAQAPAADAAVAASAVHAGSTMTVETVQNVQPSAATSAPAVAVPVVDQIATAATSNASQLDQQIVIRLDPPTLGEVRLTLRASGQEVHATLQVSNPQTMQQIRHETSDLVHRLSEGGIHLRRMDVVMQDVAPAQASQGGDFNAFYRQDQGRDPQGLWQQAANSSPDSQGRQEQGSGSRNLPPGVAAADVAGETTPTSAPTEGGLNVWM